VRGRQAAAEAFYGRLLLCDLFLDGFFPCCCSCASSVSYCSSRHSVLPQSRPRKKNRPHGDNARIFPHNQPPQRMRVKVRTAFYFPFFSSDRHVHLHSLQFSLFDESFASELMRSCLELGDFFSRFPRTVSLSSSFVSSSWLGFWCIRRPAIRDT